MLGIQFRSLMDAFLIWFFPKIAFIILCIVDLFEYLNDKTIHKELPRKKTLSRTPQENFPFTLIYKENKTFLAIAINGHKQFSGIHSIRLEKFWDFFLWSS